MFVLSTLALLAGDVVWAGSGLSDAETSFRGAILLEAGVDASVDAYGIGDLDRGGRYGQSEYAYWSGNTLYVGAEDEFGNSVDGIVEFFWFESSIDRGADFYVAVIKARTTPNVADDWYLDVDPDEPVQQVKALGGRTPGQAFRWDWSVPFENYGIDSYGQVKMKSAYGVSADAEGSAMAADTWKEDGTKASYDVQVRGNLSASYQVSTSYTIELWSWYTRVHGTATEQSWTTTLDNDTKTEESAYYEYFLVMQAKEGQPFVIDELQLGGSFDEWWWGVWNQASVTLYDVELSRPGLPEDPDTGDSGDPGDGGDTGTVDGGDGGDSGDSGPPDADPGDDEGLDLPASDPVVVDQPGGCATTPMGGGLALLLGLLGLRRRR